MMERVLAIDLKVGNRLQLSGLGYRTDIIELERRLLADWSLNCYVRAGQPVTVTVMRITPNNTGYRINTREGHTFTLSRTQKVRVIR